LRRSLRPPFQLSFFIPRIIWSFGRFQSFLFCLFVEGGDACDDEFDFFLDGSEPRKGFFR
jgi:hypothetical protein